jgi:hypothetical protein
VTLASASSSQPESGLDREDVPDDVQESTTGTDDRSGLIRAERFGDTRTYTIRCDTTDPAGDRASCSATVIVPTSRRWRNAPRRTAAAESCASRRDSPDAL